LEFNVENEEKYQPVQTKIITVMSSIPDRAQFAISNRTTYKMIRILNPWLKGRSLTVRNGKPIK
jgi:hypothetical protein